MREENKTKLFGMDHNISSNETNYVTETVIGLIFREKFMKQNRSEYGLKVK